MKRILFITMFFLMILSLNAYDFRNNTTFTVEMGPQLSWTKTTCNFINHDEITAIPQLSYALYVKMSNDLSETFSLQSKVGFEQYNAKDEFKFEIVTEDNEFIGYGKSKHAYSVSLLDMDMKVNYSFFDKFNLGIGGFCSIPISELKMSFKTPSYNEEEADYDESIHVRMSELNRPFAGLSGVLSYDFNPFMISFNYKYGLNSMLLNGKSVGIWYDIKPRSMSVLLGYNF